MSAAIARRSAQDSAHVGRTRRSRRLRAEIGETAGVEKSALGTQLRALPDLGYSPRMQLRLSLVIILLLPGCSRFGVRDAATRIAVSRQCDSIDLSIVEGYRGGFEADGCGHIGLWHCEGGHCRIDSEASDGRGTPRRVLHARHAAVALQREVLACTPRSALTLQLLVGGDGRVRQFIARPFLDPDERACLSHLLLGTYRAPGSGGEMLLSHRFERIPSPQPSSDASP